MKCCGSGPSTGKKSGFEIEEYVSYGKLFPLFLIYSYITNNNNSKINRLYLLLRKLYRRLLLLPAKWEGKDDQIFSYITRPSSISKYIRSYINSASRQLVFAVPDV